MAVPGTSCWTAILSACLALTVSTDCGTDCAFCTVHLRLQQTNLNSLTCVLQCEERVDAGGSWSACRDLLRLASAVTEGNAVSMDMAQQDGQRHPPEKKYGGFMKRYGGFMKRYGGFMKRYGGFMKKTAELYGPEPDDIDHGREILTYHSADEADAGAGLGVGGVAGGGEEGVAKRYGVMGRGGGVYDSVGGAMALQKRYGGFMRRVGRPEWGAESKRYGGFLKRSREEEEEPEEEEEELEKRYGGFMGY